MTHIPPRFGAFAALMGALLACVCTSDRHKGPLPGANSGDPSNKTAPSQDSSQDGTTPKWPPLENRLIEFVKAFSIDGGPSDAAASDMAAMTEAAHPFGSERQKGVAEWLQNRLKPKGAKISALSYNSATPNPAVTSAMMLTPIPATIEKTGFNVFAWDLLKSNAPCMVAMASHYDTKIVAGTNYLGANDGASSSIALVRLAAYLRSFHETKNAPETICDIMMIWFDGEEAQLPNWQDGETIHPAKIQDNTYGSRNFAAMLTPCDFQGQKAKCLPPELGGQPLAAVILMDMIGSPNLTLVQDTFSTPSLLKQLALTLQKLGASQILEKTPRGIEDDHLPIINAGVAAIDLIDFSHLNYWHQAGDTSEKISYESMELASKVALTLALSVATSPKVFISTSDEKYGINHQGL